MSDHDDFSEQLRRDWFAGRARQIHEELKVGFDRYIRELHTERMKQVLKASGDEESTDPLVLATANTVSASEGVLVAVAMYLARQEANTPEA